MKGFSSKCIALKIYMLQDRNIYCLQARPGNFHCGSEGVNSWIILLRLQIRVERTGNQNIQDHFYKLTCLQRVLAGTEIPGGDGRRRLYLLLHCHHHSDSCITMGSDESPFNILLVVRAKLVRQCPQTTISWIHCEIIQLHVLCI